MYTIIAFCVIAIVCALYWTRKDQTIDSVGISIIFGMLGALLGVLLALLLSPIGEYVTYEADAPVKLLAMRSSDSLEGSFLFASGHIGGELEYVYYEETADGGYQAKTMYALSPDVTVYEDQDLQGGSLTEYRCVIKQKYPWLKKFVIEGSGLNGCPSRFAFHIPKGSLIQKFSIQ